MTDKSYEQSAGFLRILNGSNPLDKTNIQQLEFYKELATELNLLRTCGSDFHNERATKLIGLDDDECSDFIKKIKGY